MTAKTQGAAARRRRCGRASSCTRSASARPSTCRTSPWSWRASTPGTRRTQEILTEPRLLEAVRVRARAPGRASCGPPRGSRRRRTRSTTWAWTGVPVVPFPRWLRCPRCQQLAPIDSGLFELKRHVVPAGPHPVRPPELQGHAASRPTVVPARFIVACPRGHLDEFPWIEFCHADGAVHRPPDADRVRDWERGPVDGSPGRVRGLRAQAPPVARVRRERAAHDAAVPRATSAPRAVRRELPGARPRDAARRFEQLVPDHAVGAVAPGVGGPDRAGGGGALGDLLRGRQSREPRLRRSSSSRRIKAPQGHRPRRTVGGDPGAQGWNRRPSRPRSTSRDPSGRCSGRHEATSPATSASRRRRSHGRSGIGSPPWGWPSACARSSP